MNDIDTATPGFTLLGAPEAWVIVLVMLPAVVLFTWFFHRLGRDPSPRMRLLLASLRGLTLSLILLLLMDPALETRIVEKKPVVTVLLTDASASMSVKDDYATATELGQRVQAAAQLDAATPIASKSRLELAQAVLDNGTENSFLRSLARERPLKMLSFGERVLPLGTYAALEANERATAIGTALQRVLEDPELRAAPLGGIVLVSDGRNTAGTPPEELIEALRQRHLPVHCIGTGDPTALRNLKITHLDGPSVTLLNDSVVLEARLRQRGLDGQSTSVRLLVDGEVVEQQELDLGREGEDRLVRFVHRPQRTGQQEWTVDARPLPGEKETSDNRRSLTLTVRDERLKVLYIEAVPRWEYATLKDFLTRGEEAFDTHCFLLDADKGFPQESSARLAPLLRLPTTREELFAYDVLIFGDVDPQGLGAGDELEARRLMHDIRDFVEAGGGFVMLSGERYSPHAWKDTPIGELLPVVLDPSEAGNGGGADAGFRMKLTELGLDHPIMQITEDPARNRRIWEGGDDALALAPLWWFAPVKKAKPGAMPLALHESSTNAHGPHALLVAGTYGEGPVVFSALDEMWRWYRGQGPFSHHRFFGNVVRYAARTKLLAGDKRFRLTADRSEIDLGGRVTLTAWVKDKAHLPASDDTWPVVLRDPAGHEQRELLRRVEPGRFERSLTTDQLGEWSAWLPHEDGISEEHLAPLSFRVIPADAEMREPVMDERALQELSARTGGRYATLDAAQDLIRSVASGSVEIPRQRRVQRLRDRDSPFLVWIPAAILLLLTTEWLIRKNQRLI